MKSIIIFFLLSVSSQVGQCDCPLDCNKHNVINNMCYLLYKIYLKYDDAQAQCQSRGGTLAIIKDKDTNKKIADFLRENEYYQYSAWIGIKYNDTKNNFTYIDGTEMLENNYHAWGYGHPTTSYYNYPCVYADYSYGHWYNTGCSEKYAFVCQYTATPCNTRNITVANAELDKYHEDFGILYGLNVSIKCQEGYHLIGSSRVTCELFGKWSEMPKCLKGCPPPPTYPNAKIIFIKDYYLVEDVVAYSCDEGYFSIKDSKRYHFTLTYSSDRQWTPRRSGCSPIQTYKIERIEVMSMDTVNLTCDINTSNTNYNRNDRPYIWIKDSKPLLATQLEYNIDSHGDLILYNRNTKDIEGFYMCYLDGKTIIPGNTVYELNHGKSLCSGESSAIRSRYVYREGRSILLTCPHNSSNPTFAWYKDEEKFPLNYNHVLYPDGSLFIRRVNLSHQGNYTCKMTRRESFCTINITATLVVLPSAASICGNLSHSSDHPWTVSLWRKEEVAPFCYGALIHENWVITTGLCLSGIRKKRRLNIFVRFGKHPIADIESEEISYKNIVDIPIISVKVHPQSSKIIFAKDIGLVKLKQSFTFSQTIQPICISAIDLASKSSYKQSPPISGIATGWGSLETDDLRNVSLAEENMTLIPQATCFPPESRYNNEILCFKTTPRIKKTFAIDTGSPLEIVWQDRVYLLGIYSWGQSITGSGEYDYFTNTFSYFPWFSSFLEEE